MPVIDQRLYYNADKTQLVLEGNPEAASLAYAAGDEVPVEELATLGREEAEPVVVESDAADEEEPEAEGKMVSGPPENKAETMTPTSSSAAQARQLPRRNN